VKTPKKTSPPYGPRCELCHEVVTVGGRWTPRGTYHDECFAKRASTPGGSGGER